MLLTSVGICSIENEHSKATAYFRGHISINKMFTTGHIGYIKISSITYIHFLKP